MRVLNGRRKPIACLSYSPDGRQLAVASDGRVAVWNLADGRELVEYPLPGMFPLQVKVAFHPGGEVLAVAHERAELIDLGSGRREKLPGKGSLFNTLSFSPDGRELLGGGDHFFRWDVDTGKSLPAPRMPAVKGSAGTTWPAAVFAPDGTRLAVSRRAWCRPTNVNTTAVFDRATLEPLARFDAAGHDTKRLAFSRDGNLLAAVSGPVLRVYDLNRHAEVASLKVGTLHFMTAAFTPDGRSLATVSKDCTVRFFDAGNWSAARTYDWDIGPLLDLTFAPDGLTAAVASNTGRVLLFDLE